jgi:hypothetical protein
MLRLFRLERFISSLLYGFISCGFGACSIHPLPEDVAGVKTTQIVHRIRCEALDAVIKAYEKIQREPVEKPWRAANSSTRLNILKSIGIVFSFTLNGDEMNNVASASATFEKPLSNGTFSFNPNVADTLERQNIRTFTVVDGFEELMEANRKSRGRACQAQPPGPNYQYPITGTIGVAEMIDTFVTLAVYTDLGKEQEPDKDAPDLAMNTAPTLVDSITFTTSLTAGVTPTWMLMPVGKALQLTNASINLNVARKDIHQVIVALALPGPVSALGPITRQQIRPVLVPASNRAFGLLVTGYPRTNAQAVALEAVNHHILRFEVARSRIAVP